MEEREEEGRRERCAFRKRERAKPGHGHRRGGWVGDMQSSTQIQEMGSGATSEISGQEKDILLII